MVEQQPDDLQVAVTGGNGECSVFANLVLLLVSRVRIGSTVKQQSNNLNLPGTRSKEDRCFLVKPD